MKRSILKQILSDLGYSQDSIKSMLVGRMRPNPDTRYALEKEHGIPFGVWGSGIKFYLQDNDTDTHTNKSTAKA